ncbi:MAG: FAD dependent oxidoreductase [Benniella sp.]|nr:MAG: FAD dependent oxidoreductase [Benniella sp.]
MWRHLASRSASCKRAITAGLHHLPLSSSRARPTHRETILLKQDQYRRLFSSSVSASLAAYTPTETVEYEVDHLVIGAGVVGLAVAERLASRGVGSTLLVDKNSGAGQETSSRNSEVIHAGLYYPVDSLKTKLCIRGNELMYDFCEKYNVQYRQTTKWVVGQSDADLEYLEGLSKKAHALLYPTKRMPGPPTFILTQDQMLSQEPHVKGKAALVSPRTGIVDAHGLMHTLEARIQDKGGDVVFQCEVIDIERICHDGLPKVNGQDQQSLVGTGGFRVKMASPAGSVVVKAATVINSAGLYADKIYNLLLARDSSVSGAQAGHGLSNNKNDDNNSKRCTTPLPPFKLHPCKGHYYSYSGPALASRLVYPVPDKNLASLGTHLTLDLAGRMRFGPDVLYVDRLDDYTIDSSTVGSRASLEMIARVVGSYLGSVNPSLLYADYAGIRPKLAGPGEPFRDFIIHHHGGFVNLAGIESPGLTSSLAIAEYVEEMLY